ncbi:MAG: sugar-binding domain-containing protein [Lachnospiraceae bacterium]|nr:sugar-binding domain-containing protein [Lachnospiraceae bacterium]
MYYEHHYNQMTIAEKLNLSRPYVSKLLQEANTSGIVKITIHDPLSYESSLERRIRLDYGLQRVFITPCVPGEDTVNQVASSAARYLNSIIKNGDIIGISNGSTIHHFALNAIYRDDLSDIQLVQLSGEYIELSHHISTKENMKLVSEALQATPYGFPCPLFFENQAIKQAVLKDKNIRRVTELQRKANIVVFSIGSLGTVGTNSLMKSGYLTQETFETLMRSGTVGDIFSHFIDRNGQPSSPELDKRNVSLSLSELLKKEQRICLASGRAKLDVLKAALVGKYISVLAIDEELAKGLCKQN